ncbi:MAG: ABC-2 family transporter protein [Crinalium sp.]
MKRLIRTSTTFLSTYYAHMVEYRAELLFWALSNSLPLILMGVWNQAAQSGKFGLSPIDLVRYFFAVFMVRQLTIVWVVWDFEREVVEGTLSPRLLQPIDPAWHHIAGHISERLARIPFTIGLVILFFVLYPQAFWIPKLQTLLLCLIATLLAFVLRFIIQYTFGMLAFWTERATAIEQLWYLFYLFLSGLIAPLELFPETVRNVVQWTPFPYMIHFPAAILIGLPVNIGQGLLVIIGWSVFFFVLNRWLWRKGLKHYSGMGA